MIKPKYTERQVKPARYAKALSYPVRIQILEILSKQSRCYSSDIADDLPIARSTWASLTRRVLYRESLEPA